MDKHRGKAGPAPVTMLRVLVVEGLQLSHQSYRACGADASQQDSNKRLKPLNSKKRIKPATEDKGAAEVFGCHFSPS